MKKIFTLIATALMAVSVSAQNYYMKKDGDRYVCLSAEEMKTVAPDVDLTKEALTIEAGTVLFENEDLTISAAVTSVIWPASWGDKSGLTNAGFDTMINLGSTLDQFFGGDEQIFDVKEKAKGNQSIIAVTPKKDGVLEFGVYNTKNKRAIGIYQYATTDEEIDNEEFGWVAYANYRNGDPEKEEAYECSFHGTTHEMAAPEHVYGDVKAGKTYLLLGSQTNQNLYEITFTAGATGISSAIIENTAKSNVMYNLAGQRIAAPVSGQIYILNGKKYIAK